MEDNPIHKNDCAKRGDGLGMKAIARSQIDYDEMTMIYRQRQRLIQKLLEEAELRERYEADTEW